MMRASVALMDAVNRAYADFTMTMVADQGQAPYRSGNLRKDLFFWWLTDECGINIPEIKDQMAPQVEIIDEQKYSMFVLKWS